MSILAPVAAVERAKRAIAKNRMYFMLMLVVLVVGGCCVKLVSSLMDMKWMKLCLLYCLLCLRRVYLMWTFEAARICLLQGFIGDSVQ